MYAFLKTITNAIDITISKKLLKNISATTYLKNKYLLGFMLYLIYAFTQGFNITSEGIFYLVLIVSIILMTQFLSYTGLKLINASTFGVIHQSKIIVVLFIGILFGNVFTLYKLLSVILCVIGVRFMMRGENTKKEQKNKLLGTLLTSISVILIAVNVNIIEYAFNNSMFSQTTYVVAFVVGVMLFFNIKALLEKPEETGTLDKKEFMYMQIAGVLATGTIAFQSLAIEHLGAFLTSVTASITPALVLLFSVAIGTEKLNYQKVIGITLAICGVIVATLLT
jgi:drug/metabolite transporter (DMT)-like permease